MSTINFDSVLARFEQQQQAANAANAERYDALLAAISDLGSQTGQTYDAALGDIENLGTAARERVRQQRTRASGQAEQDLISRGLGNTTVRQSVQRGIASDAELAQQNIDEQVGAQRSGIRQGLAGNQLQVGSMLANAIQGRNDVGPDLGLYAQLLQAAAAGDTQQRQATVGPTTPTRSLWQQSLDRNALATAGQGGAGGGGSGGGGAGGSYIGNQGGSGGGGNRADVVVGGSLPPVDTEAAGRANTLNTLGQKRSGGGLQKLSSLMQQVTGKTHYDPSGGGYVNA